jgi:glyceraldehyde-3-phosphate dehydrogenase (NADP+)
MGTAPSSPDWPVYLAGRWQTTDRPLDVLAPWDGRTVGRTYLGDDAAFEEAAEAATAAAPEMAALPAYERAAILRRVSTALLADRDAIAGTLAAEAGKPIGESGAEVDRAAFTFSVAADESLRLGGEMLPLDLMPQGARRFAVTRRVPLGPVAGISPFNFPLNLAAHKLAPAVAAGDPIVLKPATRTPLSALVLARLLDEAGLPKGALSILPLDRKTGDRLVTDDRFKLLTFTGSSAVGWSMKAKAGRKRVVLELGGNAGVIIDRDADVDRVADRVIAGGFAYAGQSCISVQRVYVHDALLSQVADALVARLERLVVGDPLDAATDVGPLITAEEAERVDGWVREAVAAGARVLTGGRRVGQAAYAPTVLADVPDVAKVCAEEVFAPLVGLYPFSGFADAIDAVNRSRYGLQAGVFTNTLAHALAAFERLQVGGVILNDVPAWRIDHMPYGGVKDSGFGREGPRYAIEYMTELKLLVVTQDV